MLRNTQFGEWPRLLGGFFRRLIWGNLILSLLNKIYINSSVIRRHGGGIFDGLILRVVLILVFAHGPSTLLALTGQGIVFFKR